MITLEQLRTVVDRFVEAARGGCWELTPDDVLISSVVPLPAPNDSITDVTVFHTGAGSSHYYVYPDGTID